MQEIEHNAGPEVTGKVILGILYRYRLLIIGFVLVFTVLASVYAYLKPSVYRSYTNIKLKDDTSSKDSVLLAGMAPGVENRSNEIALIESSLMINKVLQRVDIGTRYFYKNKFKKHEVYKDAPFVVNIVSMEPLLYGRPIYISPVDKEHFVIEIKDTPFSFTKLKKLLFSQLPPSLNFRQEYKYGEEVVTKWFNISVQKLNENFNREYFITHIPNQYMQGLISSGLSVNFTADTSSILNISYMDTVPLRAQEIVNAVTHAYFEDEVNQRLQATEKTLKYLDDQLAVLTKILNKSASKLKSFKQSNTEVTLEGIADSAASKISDLEAKKQELGFEEKILFNLQAYVNSEKDLSMVTLSEAEISDSALIEKIKRFQDLNIQYRKSLTVYTEFHPEVIKIADEINRMRQSIKYLVDSDLDRIKQRKAYLGKEIEKLQNSLTALPQKERVLANLSRNYSVNEKIYSFLLERRTEMQILHSSTTSNVRILDEAIVPGIAIKPKRAYITVIGSILGFVTGSLLAFILYFRDDSIKSVEEVEARVKIPFLGLIPQREGNKYTISYEEAFRTLRTNIEFLQGSNTSKVLLVASPISGEGKSTTVKNLSEMFSKLNKKVIVLDFDLRRPSLHKYFKDISNHDGVSMLLSGQSSLAECIQQRKDGISVIAAGPIPPNPSELIMSDATDMLIKTLSKTFDYIIIDTPPYSVVTDSIILMKKVDIVLFSIMQGHSKRDTIERMNNTLNSYEIKSAGIVYHGVELKKKERHGYGYYETT